MKLVTKEIETKRLILRPYSMEDAEAMLKNWASDPEVTRYLTWKPYDSVEAARQWILEKQPVYETDDIGDWVIVEKASGEAIGGIGIASQRDDVKSVHVGYCLGKAWWHRGYMTESFSALIDYLFTETPVLRVEARHDPRNVHSGDVMKKCGLTYEGTLRQSDCNNQGICDAAYYGLLKDDYSNRKQG